MILFLLTFIVIVLAITAMAVGVLLGRAPIRGSCGGLGNAGGCAGCSSERCPRQHATRQ